MSRKRYDLCNFDTGTAEGCENPMVKFPYLDRLNSESQGQRSEATCQCDVPLGASASRRFEYHSEEMVGFWKVSPFDRQRGCASCTRTGISGLGPRSTDWAFLDNLLINPYLWTWEHCHFSTDMCSQKLSCSFVGSPSLRTQFVSHSVLLQIRSNCIDTLDFGNVQIFFKIRGNYSFFQRRTVLIQFPNKNQ